MTDAPKLLSREDDPREVLADFLLQGHLTYRAPGLHGASDYQCADAMIRDLAAVGVTVASTAHIAALEAERDAALSRAAEYLAKASHAEPVTDADMAWGETMAAGLSRIEAKTYARALEDAAKVADAEERECAELRDERPHDSYHWSFWERARKSASCIAAAIRALKPHQEP